jgi:hypothetical protein
LNVGSFIHEPDDGSGTVFFYGVGFPFGYGEFAVLDYFFVEFYSCETVDKKH